MLDNLERRAREALAAIPRSRTARDADRMREPLRRELERSLGIGRLPWPPALRPRVVGTLRRDGIPHRESDLRVPARASPVPAHLYVPEGLDRPAPAVLFYPGHWWPDSKARPGLPGLLHQHGPARLRRAQLRPVRPGGAGRLVARPPPHRGAAGRGRPAGVRRVRDPLRAGVPALAARGRSASGSGSPGPRAAATTPGSPRRSTTGSRRPCRWWAPASSPSRSTSAGRSTGTTRPSTATSSPA